MKLIILLIFAALMADAQTTTYGFINQGTTDLSRGALIPPGATFASPPASPAIHHTYRFTDATSLGTCTGGGSAIALCEWSGSAWVAISGGSGGGGTASTPFTITRTNPTTLTLGAECAVSTPCNYKFGNTTTQVVTSATAVISAGATTARFYVSPSTGVTVGHNMTIACTNCTQAPGVSAIPADSIPLYACTATGGAWDVGGCTDLRAVLTTKNIVVGTGLTSVESGGTTTISATGGGGSSARTVRDTSSAAYSILSTDSTAIINSTNAAATVTLPLAGAGGFTNPWCTVIINNQAFTGLNGPGNQMTLNSTSPQTITSNVVGQGLASMLVQPAQWAEVCVNATNDGYFVKLSAPQSFTDGAGYKARISKNFESGIQMGVIGVPTIASGNGPT